MFILGLTGSLGMGKSTVARMFAGLGVPVHDADAASRAAAAPNGPALPALKQVFPDCFKPDGTLDRHAMGRVIFTDPAKRKELEAIIHPYVWAAERVFLTRARRAKKRLVVLDIPLLYETGADQRVDAVLVVTAPPFVQLARARARGMDDAQLARILSTQVPDGDKRRMADFVIPTGLGKGVTFRAVRHLINQLRR